MIVLIVFLLTIYTLGAIGFVLSCLYGRNED